jgi:hypothetical protein
MGALFSYRQFYGRWSPWEWPAVEYLTQRNWNVYCLTGKETSDDDKTTEEAPSCIVVGAGDFLTSLKPPASPGRRPSIGWQLDLPRRYLPQIESRH